MSFRAHMLRPAFAALAFSTAAASLFTVSTADARSSRGEPRRVELPTRFAQCPQFFANGQPPQVPRQPALHELCYEAFAILHSGATRTPVYVAQRLNRGLIEDVDEKRADRFFADARLPSDERRLDHFSVKEAVMPFGRFPGADTILGPEMKSTG